MIITIDGPAGTGKTTIARLVSKRLGIPYCDTGAMYRSVAWAILQKGISLSDEPAIKRLLEDFKLEIRIEGGDKKYFVNSVDVTEEIRSQKINEIVSETATIKCVREALWKEQRTFALQHGAVFEGRDMGSVVFPDAELKIFLTARSEIRAERRLKELHAKLPEEAKKLDRAAMVAELARRDQIDSGRELAPLKKPDGAVEIDTSDLTLDQVVECILIEFKQAQKKTIRKISPAWLKRPKLPFLYRFILFITWCLFKLFYRYRVYGLEHFYPKAALIAPNHTSYFDPPIVGISWPEEVHYLAKEGLFRNRFFGGFIRALNSHPVHGDAADVGVFKTILGLLAEGKKVVLFPEGGRSEDGQLQHLKPGIGLLLSRSKSAIIPTYIQGTYEIWGPKRRSPKLFGKVTCVFGTPILWENFSHLEKKQAQVEIARRLEESILALKKWLEEGAQGVPP